MDNKHFILGTAGHVDHGKTSLIRMLTGYDCDTHKEEKRRGITINLGFTHINLPNGNSLGVVDVPGHADFIDTMISGASGIDLVLLVIAADEGIMPQTKEHLDIIKLLGIKDGLIILNKIDLVDDELKALALEELESFIKGSIFGKNQIIEFSAINGKGMDKLITEICRLTEISPPRNSEGNFRMYIDRIFTVQGHGTVVNGSVLSGKVDKAAELFLLPGNRKVRIRRIEHHGQEVDQVTAGDRASLNITGLKKEEFQRGMLLTDKYTQDTTLIDAKLTIFDNIDYLPVWSQVMFMTGTLRTVSRMHLLERNKLSSGETGLVQIYLNEPAAVFPGDRFIIRSSSDDVTFGGGEIIDPYPLHHRRRREKTIEDVRKRSTGELSEIFAAEVRKSVEPLTLNQISDRIHLSTVNIEEILEDLPDDITFYSEKNNYVFIRKDADDKVKEQILCLLEKHHKNNTISEDGLSFNELMGVFGKYRTDGNKFLLELILASFINRKKLKTVGSTYSLFSHKANVNNKAVDIVNKLKLIMNAEGKFHEKDKLFQLAKLSMSKIEFEQAVSFLIQNKEIIVFQGKFVQSEFIGKAMQIIETKTDLTKGFTVAEFRDLFGMNRDSCIIILEYLDQIKYTIRKENTRIKK